MQRRLTYADMTDEINAGFPGGKRVMWWSLNIKVDKDLMSDICEHGMKIFAPYLETVLGIEWDMVAQPIPYVFYASRFFACLIFLISVRMIEQSRKNGGDLSGLQESDGDQWCKRTIISFATLLTLYLSATRSRVLERRGRRYHCERQAK